MVNSGGIVGISGEKWGKWLKVVKESGLSTGVGQTAKMWLSEKCYY